MNIYKFLARAWFMRLLLLAVAASALYWGIGAVRASIHAASLAAVNLTGVHHLGEKFNIPQFYLAGYDGSNVGREGGGGRSVCCVLLPKKWRPGLSVEVRWEIGDWSKENHAELEAGNFNSVSGMAYIARVPVERYEVAEHVWVHFFPGAKVRVVSSPIGSEGSRHPVREGDPHAGDSATAGRRIPAMFSPKELAEIDRRNLERKKAYGDWR